MNDYQTIERYPITYRSNVVHSAFQEMRYRKCTNGFLPKNKKWTLEARCFKSPHIKRFPRFGVRKVLLSIRGFSFLKMLLNQELKNKIFITKSNAAYWKKGMRPEQRYFLTVEDLAQGFVKGNFGQNITFHHVPFQDFSALQYIILERLPAQHTNLFEDAYHEIRNKLRELGYSIPLVIRKCDDDCKCFNEYNKMSYDKLLKYFKTKGDQ